MASPERLGALVDAAAAPARRGGRLTGLASSAGRFVLAYLAFEIASVSAGVVFSWAVRHNNTGQGLLIAGVLFGAVSAPSAWLPLSVVLYPALKSRIPPLVACLTAGAITGAILAVPVAVLLASVLAKLNPSDTAPELFEDLSFWLNIVRLPDILTIGAPSGALGGLAFWAAYFWPSLVQSATRPQQEA